jgi:Spx/MgsR family transcriptional regulator
VGSTPSPYQGEGWVGVKYKPKNKFMTILYGIKNCDTVKKTRDWLEQNNIDYRFHDFRADGLHETQIKSWIAEIGLETLVNKRSTTWKELDDAIKNNFDEKSAPALIAANPTLIKRPLLDTGKKKNVGFKDTENTQIFK